MTVSDDATHKRMPTRQRTRASNMLAHLAQHALHLALAVGALPLARTADMILIPGLPRLPKAPLPPMSPRPLKHSGPTSRVPGLQRPPPKPSPCCRLAPHLRCLALHACQQYLGTCVHARIHACMFGIMCVYMCTYIQTDIHVHLALHAREHNLYTNTHTNTNTNTNTNTHTRTHTHTHLVRPTND